MSYRLAKAIALAICLPPLAACSTARPATPISCVASIPLAHEERIERSVGAEMPREELLSDDVDARSRHETVRLKFNALVDDMKACQ